MKRNTLVLSTLCFQIMLLILYAGKSLGQNKADGKPTLRTYALKINVSEMEKALFFYQQELGFEVEDKSHYPEQVVLKSNDRVKLVLNKVKALRKNNLTDTSVSFTLQVNDLDKAIEKMQAAGVEFDGDRRREGVGNAIYIRDPFGNRVSLMHMTIIKVEPFAEPKIFNFGYGIPDMAVGRDFYAGKLGFVEYTERYLPLDMPLRNPDNSFGFMLHYREGIKSIRSDYPKTAPFCTIVFETGNLSKATEELKKNKIRIVSKNGESIVFEDPFGNISEIVQVRRKAE